MLLESRCTGSITCSRHLLGRQNVFCSFLTKTKQDQALPRHFDGEIWPHSTQFWLWFFLYWYVFLRHPVATPPIRMNHIILLLLSESGWETLYALCWLSGSIKMPYRSNNYPTPLDKQASLARTSFSWLIRCQVISTDGALRLTKTYDNHPTHHIHPSIHPHIAFKTTSPLKILSNKCEQSYRSNGSNQSNRSNQSNQSNQGHQEFPPESVIKKSNQIAFSVWVLKHIRP